MFYLIMLNGILKMYNITNAKIIDTGQVNSGFLLCVLSIVNKAQLNNAEHHIFQPL